MSLKNPWMYFEQGLALLARPPSRRSRVPEMLQSEISECGAACLGMILGYFGRWVPMSELRNVCSVGRDGVSAGKLVRVARQLGLFAKGFSVPVRSLGELPFPQILFWNFNHFVVLERLDEKWATLIDPAFGRRKIPRENLERLYSGVTLSFAPSETFTRAGDPPSALREMKSAAVGLGPMLGTISIVSLAIALIIVMIPAFSSIFIDYVLIRQGIVDWRLEFIFGIALLGLVLIPAIALQRQGILRLQTRLSLDLATRIMTRLFTLPTAFFYQRYSGDLGGRVMLADAAASTVSGPLVTMLAAGIQVTIFGLVMIGYSPKLALITFLLLGCQAILGGWITTRLSELSRRLAFERGRYEAQLLQSLANVEQSRAAGLSDEITRRTLTRNISLTNAEQANAPYGAVITTAPGAISGVLIALITAASALEVLGGAFSIGMFVAFNALVMLLISPFNQIVSGIAQVGSSAGSFERINDLLKTEPDPVLVSAAGRSPDYWHIRAEKVGYRYGSAPILENLTFDIPEGSRLGLVGGVGSGKSTLLRILAQLEEPTEGCIFADSLNYREINRDAFCKAVSFVPQSIEIFEGNILDNITLWNSDISEQDVIEACQKCALHDDISRRLGGYRSRLRAGGYELSGGQRQRLGLARALVRKPKVLLLDEATSALDKRTEATILEALSTFQGTLIFATHHDHVLQFVDEVIVLEGGRIVRGIPSDAVSSIVIDARQTVIRQTPPKNY